MIVFVIKGAIVSSSILMTFQVFYTHVAIINVYMHGEMGKADKAMCHINTYIDLSLETQYKGWTFYNLHYDEIFGKTVVPKINFTRY